jgi:hypothetical protein
MPMSARNKLRGKIKEIELGDIMALWSCGSVTISLRVPSPGVAPTNSSPLTWIIHQGSSQKRKDALKGMMNTGFADPAFPFGASIT